MILISHRGNLSGPVLESENKQDYIEYAMSLGYDVEIDVWFQNNKFYLGHDEPKHEISHDFLINEKLWCHAKNIDALIEMKKSSIHYFWHETDTITLTSKNYIWAYPRSEIIPESIAVKPETNWLSNLDKCIGICSDYISRYL